MRGLVPIVVALGVVAAPRAVSAHPLDLGYLTIERTADRLALHLELDLKAAAAVLATEPEALDEATLAARAPELAARTYARAPITGCSFGPAITATRSGRTVRISGGAACTPGPHRWAFPFVQDHVVSPRFQLMVKDTVAGEERLTLIDPATPAALELGATAATVAAGSSAGSAVGLATFVWSGIEHIGAAPAQWRTPEGSFKLPDGIDHILFLLALMLGGGTLLQLAGVASGFTLGHSITLALAALDIVRPPAAIIEPLIALSIALAAVEAFTGRFKAHRWKIAAGFGLIHGFGFASALAHLDLSTRGEITALFGYNLGVELGQLAVVLCVAPLVLLAYRQRARPGIPLAVRLASSAICVAGLYWFVQRLGMAA